MAVNDYSTDPDLNTTISGINIAEGCAPSGINNAIRQLMADVKEESAALSQSVEQAGSDAESKVSALNTTLRQFIAEEVAKYLPLAGGTMAGSIKGHGNVLVGDANNTYVQLCGGVSYGNGASVQIHGRNSDRPGAFVIHCSNGTIAADLALSPESAEWAGKQVLTANDFPAGSVIAYAGNPASLPGFLVCNGAAVSRSTYATLFSAIGTTYGAGNGSTTFSVPNMTDKFIQGGATSGVVKSAGLPEISANAYRLCIGTSNMGGAGTGAFSVAREATNYAPNGATAGEYKSLNFKASESNGIYGASSTVQPPAISMRYYIKY